MRGVEFLFGRRKRAGASIGDRINIGAKSQLDRKIIKNPVNRWWLVLFRNYVFWPVVKLPFLPVVEAMDVRKKLHAFRGANEVLIDAGHRTTINLFRPLRLAIERKISWHRALHRFLISIVWKPSFKPRNNASLRDLVGGAMLWEKSLCLKLFILTMSLWSASIFFFAWSIEQLVTIDGGQLVYYEIDRYRHGASFSSVFLHGQSGALRLWSISCALWVLSFFLSYLLASRPWIKLSEHVREYLKETGAFRAEELDTKGTVLAMPEMIYISTPSMAENKIRGLRSGWPGNFLPGELIGNTRRPDDLIVLRRPERKNIVFGGDYARTQILDYLKAWESGILAIMKNALKRPADEELYFLGEVIDPRWWQSSQIYLSMGSSPHCFIVGATRSGKTKSVLSLVYSLARAYPDSLWYFADGKGSADYDPFAEFFSVFPVAKGDDPSGDTLVQLANIIDDIWSELSRRKQLFSKATLDGKPCSTIYQYRELVGPLPQIFLCIDEFAVFFQEMMFEQNYRTDGTLANRLKRLVAETASYGIHMILASQRYQVTDMPSIMRSNLTNRLVHNVQLTDANLLETPEAPTLDTGQFILTASGLFCRHTGISKVKAKLPYIGDKPIELLRKTVPPFDKSKKRMFDSQLIYNRGSNDLEKISVVDFSNRLQRFLNDQDYDVRQLVNDLEATELQLEMVKSERTKITDPDGTIKHGWRPLEGAPIVGISLLRNDEIDEDTLINIQNQYGQYSVVIIFLLGRPFQASKYKFVEKLNEKGTRFHVVPYREYYKDMRFVEMKRKEGKAVDVIQPKLQRLGFANVSHALAAESLQVSELSPKSPVKLKISKLLAILHLTSGQDESDVRDIPCTRTILPGGTHLYFLIMSQKEDRQNVKETAINLSRDSNGVVIVTPHKFLQADVKEMGLKNIVIWSIQDIGEYLKGAEADAGAKLLDELFKKLGLQRTSGLGSQIKIAKTAKVEIQANIDTSTEKVTSYKVVCGATNYTISHLDQELEIDQYRLDVLGIPPTAKITVLTGPAPQGTDRKNLILAGQAASDSIVFPDSSRWTVDRGILSKKKSSISNDDPLLRELMDYED